MKYKIILIFVAVFLLYHVNASGMLGSLYNSNSIPALAETEESYSNPYPDVPLHDYDWDNLSKESGRLKYTVPKGFEPVQGVDVSRYQGDIDWSQVRASGISFAILRAGYRGYESGIIKLDEKFLQNLEQASASGLAVGVYFFSQAITEEEAVEEARFILDNIKGYSIDYPIVFDLEEISQSDHRTFSLTKEARTKIAIAFCEAIEKSGHTAMIYGNASWLTDYFDLNEIRKYDIWLAQYADQPTFPYQFEMWQYTNQGYVDGIDHVVDINLCFVPYV